MERLRNHGDFVAVLRGRKKVTSRDLVVHYMVRHEMGGAVGPAVFRALGLAVSKAVGHAVVRNTVKRRFRVLARDNESLLPPQCFIVMRAKPSAANATFQNLDDQVKRCFGDIQVRYRSGAGTPIGAGGA